MFAFSRMKEQQGTIPDYLPSLRRATWLRRLKTFIYFVKLFTLKRISFATSVALCPVRGNRNPLIPLTIVISQMPYPLPIGVDHMHARAAQISPDCAALAFCLELVEDRLFVKEN